MFFRVWVLPEQFQELDSPEGDFKSMFSCAAQCSARRWTHAFLRQSTKALERLLTNHSEADCVDVSVPLIADMMLSVFALWFAHPCRVWRRRGVPVDVTTSLR